MKSSIKTWLPLDIGDYLKNTQALSTEEHGAYLLLIMAYWITGPIKNDKKTIKNITKLSYKKCENLLRFFYEKDGHLHHERVEEEISKAKQNQEESRNRTKGARDAKAAKKLSVTEPVTGSKKPSVTGTPLPLPKNNEGLFLDAPEERIKWVDGWFSKFWGLYPVKVEMNKAKDAFEACLSAAQPEAILEGLEHYVKFKPKWQEYAFPAKWLAEGRWPDRYQADSQEASREPAGESWSEQLQRLKESVSENQNSLKYRQVLEEKLGSPDYKKYFTDALIIVRGFTVFIIPELTKQGWIANTFSFALRTAAGNMNLNHKLLSPKQYEEVYKIEPEA